MILPEFDTPEKITCLKNPDYYLYDNNGNALPYLDTVEFIIEGKKLTQLEYFENKQIDLIAGLPTSRITEMLEGRNEDFQNEPPLLHLHNSSDLRIPLSGKSIFLLVTSVISPDDSEALISRDFIK